MLRQLLESATGTARLSELQPIRVDAVWDCHDRAQIQGDGTAARPAVYNRDLFVLRPFQVDAPRFAVPYYLMTRNVAVDLPDERFGVTLLGVPDGDGVHDPGPDRAGAVRRPESAAELAPNGQ